MRLIYFSPVWWQSYEQRPHKFVRYFRKRFGGEVLWVQPYPMRLPSRNDFQRSNSVLDQQTSPVEGVTCLPVSALPIEPLPAIRSFNVLLRSLAWKRIKSFAESADRLIIGVGKPSTLALQALKRLEYDTSFYDAMDNFPDFYRGLSRKYMSRIEVELTAAVDCVFASSTPILRYLERYSSSVHLLHNACDADSIPYRRQPAGIPVFGYVGSVGNWFDWNMLAELADAMPESEFRLVGPVFVPPKIPLPTNVVLVGAMTHREAIRAMADFSVGLIPFKNNRLTAGVDPIKYYEYICTGLPVVSTDFGEMQHRETAEGVFKIAPEGDKRSVLRQAAETVLTLAFVETFRRRNSWNERLREGLAAMKFST